jgi:putative transposase
MDRWHFDEVMITVKYLWRAVNSQGNVLDVLMQRQRDTKATKRFFCKLLKQQVCLPRVIVTDKLKSYEVAKNQMIKSEEQRRHKGLNNQAEDLHQPTQMRER